MEQSWLALQEVDATSAPFWKALQATHGHLNGTDSPGKVKGRKATPPFDLLRRFAQGGGSSRMQFAEFFAESLNGARKQGFRVSSLELEFRVIRHSGEFRVIRPGDAYPDMRAPDKWKLARHFIDRLSLRSTAGEEEAVWNSLRDPVEQGLREPASTYMAGQEVAHRDLPLDVPHADSRVQKGLHQ